VAASRTIFVAGAGIGEEFNVLDTLLELIEDSKAALEQRLAVLSWLDALRTAIEKPHPECVLHVCDRP